MQAARKHYAPAADRNTTPIVEVLGGRLPEGRGRVLEIASGTGQHVVSFGRNFPNIEWFASDPNPAARESISAWIEDSGVSNVAAPVDLDVSASGWADAVTGPFDAIIAINLIHISPWAVAEGLLMGATGLLRDDGLIYLYGPYRRDGNHTAESNVKFEEWLHSLSPDYGIRDLQEIEAEGARHGLVLTEVIPMPANNFSLILRRC